MEPKNKTIKSAYIGITAGFIILILGYFIFSNYKTQPLKISGKVFVVQSNKNTVPLPLVRVYIISVEEARKLKSQRISEAKSLRLEFNEIRAKYNQVEDKLSKDDKINGLIKKKFLLQVVEKLIKDKFLTNKSIQLEDTKKLKSLLKAYELREYNFEQYAQYVDTRQIQFIENKEAELINYQYIHEVIQKDLLIKLTNEIDDYKERYMRSIKHEVNEHIASMERLWLAFNLSKLPLNIIPAGEGITDDKGEFNISISKSNDEGYFIFASSSRELSMGKTEHYDWATQASKTELNILSNNNMLNDGMYNNSDPNCLWNIQRP